MKEKKFFDSFNRLSIKVFFTLKPPLTLQNSIGRDLFSVLGRGGIWDCLCSCITRLVHGSGPWSHIWADLNRWDFLSSPTSSFLLLLSLFSSFLFDLGLSFSSSYSSGLAEHKSIAVRRAMTEPHVEALDFALFLSCFHVNLQLVWVITFHVY